MIICDKVSKFILQNIDLHVPQGISLGIIGASGAGKTTFLKLVSGLLQADSGFVRTLRLDPLKNRKALASRISVLFSDVPLYDDRLSIKVCLEEMKSIYGIEEKLFSERLCYVSQVLGFAEFLNSNIKGLSLGQRRRAELGMAFLRDADLYLFDEPCIGLDQNGKAAFYKLVEEKKNEGKTVLISSHSIEDITALADRILLLDEGKLAFYGSEEEMHKRLAPMEESFIELEGQLPDISELEVERYFVEKDKMTIRYNSNHVSTKELLERICESSKIKSVSVRKADLAESIKSIKSRRKDV